MSKKQPDPPAPPDYAAANREAVMADLETLPMRRLIEAQARMGTGQFEGLGDADIAAREYAAQLAFAPQAAQAMLDLQRQYGSDFVDLSRQQSQQYDPTGFNLREGFGQRLAGGANSVESLYQQTAGGTAPDYAAYVRNNPDLLRNWETNTSKNTGMSIEDYGRQHYESNGRSEGRGLPTMATPGTNVPPAYEQIAGNGPVLDRLDAAPSLGTVGSGPAMQRLDSVTFNDTGTTAAGRSELERQIMDDLSKAGTLDPALQRAAEQAARARGSATGNLYGGGNAIKEALAVQLAQREQDASRRNNALGLLSSGQSTSDTANRLAQANLEARGQVAAFNNSAGQQEYENDLARMGFNNAASQQGFQNRQAVTGFNNQQAQAGFANSLDAINQRNQAKQNTFTAQQGQTQQRAAARQQDLANIQSFLGLAPVAQIAGYNQNAQSGASPFSSFTYGDRLGSNVNQNAGQLGTNFAQGVFGTQAGIYGQQLANSGSPLGSVLGGFAGAFSGGLGQAGGQALAKKWF